MIAKADIVSKVREWRLREDAVRQVQEGGKPSVLAATEEFHIVQLSAPQITARMVVTRMSCSECSRARSTRGSSMSSRKSTRKTVAQGMVVMRGTPG